MKTKTTKECNRHTVHSEQLSLYYTMSRTRYEIRRRSYWAMLSRTTAGAKTIDDESFDRARGAVPGAEYAVHRCLVVIAIDEETA